MTYHTTALLPNSCGPMADGPFRDPKGRSYPNWTGWSISISILTHRAQLRESRATLQILDPSMKDWYQYRPWNLTHRAQLRESGHMTYHTTALLPNSCGPMADGPFRDPNGRSCPHPNYYQIAAAQWRMVHFGTPRVGPIHTPNIGPIDEGLIWTHRWRIDINTWHIIRRPWNLTHRAQLRESGHMTYHTTALLPNSCGPMADGPFRDHGISPIEYKGRSYPHSKYWTHRWRIGINIDHGISPIEPS